MRQIKQSAILVVILLMAVLAFGCENAADVPDATTAVPTAPKPTAYRPPPGPAWTEPSEHPLKDAYKADQKAFVVFDQEDTSVYEYVPIQEILEYESLYPECNGTWFRDQLSDEDKCIYNSFLYAMEHRCTWFELYVEDNDKDFYYVREALSLDSPFLEQNKNWYGEDIWSQATNYLGERISFHVSQFVKKRWDMKMEALEKCRQIVDEIPAECVTEFEKAAYLYRYVCENVKYVAYEKMADNDYLYDAVCKGETVCDGYSNMLNLLFNLAGIKSYEAMGYNIEDFEEATPEELENASGHTWVVAELDGKFYNFDPTWEDTKDESWSSDLIYFGFSDMLAPVKYLAVEEQRPKCTDTSRDFHYADLVVDNITNYSDVEKIVRILEERASRGEYVTLLGVRDGVGEGDFDSFGRIFSSYDPDIEGVSASGREVGKAALLWLTVTNDAPTETTEAS